MKDVDTQIRGAERLVESCRAGVNIACRWLQENINDCNRNRDPLGEGGCARLAELDFVVTFAIELDEVRGCWRVASDRYRAVCIDARSVVLETTKGEFERFGFHFWSKGQRHVLEARKGRWEISARVEVFPSANGRHFRLSVAGSESAEWIYLTRKQ
jgi:hypothetical protein